MAWWKRHAVSTSGIPRTTRPQPQSPNCVLEIPFSVSCYRGPFAVTNMSSWHDWHDKGSILGIESTKEILNLLHTKSSSPHNPSELQPLQWPMKPLYESRNEKQTRCAGRSISKFVTLWGASTHISFPRLRARTLFCFTSHNLLDWFAALRAQRSTISLPHKLWVLTAVKWIYQWHNSNSASTGIVHCAPVRSCCPASLQLPKEGFLHVIRDVGHLNLQRWIVGEDIKQGNDDEMWSVDMCSSIYSITRVRVVTLTYTWF